MKSIQSRMDDAYSLMKKVCEQPSEVAETDECTLYANLLAVKLRSLDENTRGMLMHDIDNLYFHAKYKKQSTGLTSISSHQQLGSGYPNSNLSINPTIVPMHSSTHLFSRHPSQFPPESSYVIQPFPTNTYISQPSPQISISSQHSPTDEYEPPSHPIYTYLSQHSPGNSHVPQPSPTNSFVSQHFPQD